MPVAISLSQRWGAVDQPSKTKVHTVPTPLLGGISFVLAVFLCIWGHVALGSFALAQEWPLDWLGQKIPKFLNGSHQVLPRLAVITLGGLGFACIGMVDDIKNLTPRTRLLGELAIATIVISLGVRPELYILPTWLAWLVSITWLVGISNAINFIDGLDGLAGGVSLIAAMTIATTMYLYDQPMVAILLITLSGAIVGFLKSNYRDAKVFMGSTGSLFLGYMLAVSVMISTLINDKDSTIVALFMPVMVLAVPLYNMIYVIIFRFRNDLPIANHDLNHLHHRLMRLGLSPKGSVWVIYLFTFSLSINSILLIRAQWWEALIMFIQVCATVILFFVMELSRQEKEIPSTSSVQSSES